MLRVDHVSKNYGSLTVLEDINLEFDTGIYGVLAPNGAGKTTLIKMLASLLIPSLGEIFWEGTEIHSLDEKYRKILGYLPQDFGYYKNYSPTQFLRYFSVLKGMDLEEANQQIPKILEMVTLNSVENKKMKGFSGGMIQRVGIAQALLNAPKILFLDEPTTGLDPKERVRFRNMISDLASDHIIILSTHIISDIEHVARKIMMIKEKKILFFDPPKIICSRLKDQVYEINDVNEIKGEYFFLSESLHDDKKVMRYVSKKKQGDSARPVKAGLEDIFLYVYNEEVCDEDFSSRDKKNMES